MSLGGGAAARLAAVGPAIGAARREGARAEASADAGPAFELDIDARPADAGHLRDAARTHERGERIPGRDDTGRVMPERDGAARDSGIAGEDGRSQAQDAAPRRTSVAAGSQRGEREQRTTGESGTKQRHAPIDPADVPNDQGAHPRIDDAAHETGQEPASDTGMGAPLADHMLALLSATPRTAGVDAGVVASASELMQSSTAMTGVVLVPGTALGGVASARSVADAAAPVMPPVSPVREAAAVLAAPALLTADAASVSNAAAGGSAPVPNTAGAAAPIASSHPATVAASAMPGTLAGMSRADGAGSTPAPLSVDAFAAAFALVPRRTEDAAKASTIDPAPAGIGDTPLAFSLAPGAREVATIPRATEILAPVPMPADPETGFDDAFGSRIVWMAEQRLGHAELRVSPGQLGGIDIRLELDGNRVNAQFNAGNAEVRQALEAGMDRLRDLLGRQGMELAQSSVGGERRQSGGDGARGATDTGPTSDAGAPDDAPVTLRTLRARGLIDEYA